MKGYCTLVECVSQVLVHADDFLWLMFVHERFSVSEQTLNTQKHLSGLYKGKHEIKVQ